MQVDQIVQNVMDVFRRPDMLPQVEARVRGAIQWAHKQDYFPQDRVVELTAVQPPENNSLTLGLPPRFRQFERIRPHDVNDNPITLCTDTVNSVGYNEIDPHQLLGYRNSAETNWFYVAGGVLNLRTSVTPYKIEFMYYAYPDLTEGTASTWITELHQELIEFRALGVLYSIVGNQELRNTYMNLAQELTEQLLDSAFTSGSAQ